MSALSILAEECELLNDSKYRSYITQIEKALKSFDSTSEWADLISALAKLNKVRRNPSSSQIARITFKFSCCHILVAHFLIFKKFNFRGSCLRRFSYVKVSFSS